MLKRGEFIQDKTGQFYLIAAIIISLILVGFVSVSNYSKSKESITLQSSGDELKIESEKVLDYGLSNKKTSSEMKILLTGFVTDYLGSADSAKESYFLFGNTEFASVAGYSEEAKTIYVNEEAMAINEKSTTFKEFSSPGKDVTLKINEKNFDFELQKGENFYFLIFDNNGGEEHVVRN